MQDFLRFVSSILLYVLAFGIPISILVFVTQYPNNAGMWWVILASEFGTFLFTGILLTLLDIAEDVHTAIHDRSAPQSSEELREPVIK